MPTRFRLLRWSTEMLPEPARFSTFREEFARQNLALDVIDHSGGALELTSLTFRWARAAFALL
jgi:hypothetical protein